MIILDTHVLIWWVSEPKKLSRKAKLAIENAVSKNKVYVSSITIWEICMLHKKARLKLTMDLDTWITTIEKLAPIEFLPIDNSIAAKSVFLDEKLPSDSADRMIIATALITGSTLVTSDRQILKNKTLQTIW